MILKFAGEVKDESSVDPAAWGCYNPAVPDLRSWKSADFSYATVIANPRDLDELIEVVKDRDRYPSPLRVAAHRHSMTLCFATTGTQVLLRHLNDIRVDVDACTVTVGARSPIPCYDYYSR